MNYMYNVSCLKHAFLEKKKEFQDTVCQYQKCARKMCLHRQRYGRYSQMVTNFSE